jgi:hypothetical protein
MGRWTEVPDGLDRLFRPGNDDGIKAEQEAREGRGERPPIEMGLQGVRTVGPFGKATDGLGKARYSEAVYLRNLGRIPPKSALPGLFQVISAITG